MLRSHQQILFYVSKCNFCWTAKTSFRLTYHRNASHYSPLPSSHHYSIRIVFLFGVVFWNILPTTEKSGPVPTKMHKAWIYRCRLPSSIPFLTELAWYCTTPTIKASLSLNINVLTNHGNTGRFRELPSVNIFSRYRPSHHLAYYTLNRIN